MNKRYEFKYGRTWVWPVATVPAIIIAAWITHRVEMLLFEGEMGYIVFGILVIAIVLPVLLASKLLMDTKGLGILHEDDVRMIVNGKKIFVEYSSITGVTVSIGSHGEGWRIHTAEPKGGIFIENPLRPKHRKALKQFMAALKEKVDAYNMTQQD